MFILTALFKESKYELIKIDKSILSCRGFFPKGRGEVLIVPDPVVSLHPILLMDRGDINEVHITSFTAGVLPPKVIDIFVTYYIAY